LYYFISLSFHYHILSGVLPPTHLISLSTLSFFATLFSLSFQRPLYYLSYFWTGTDGLTASDATLQNIQKTVRRKEKTLKRKKDKGSAREGDNDGERSEGDRESGRESGDEGATVGVKVAKQRTNAKVRREEREGRKEGRRRGKKRTEEKRRGN
jgi:hypothetical protein